MQQRSGCVSDRGRRESRRDEATCAAEQVKPERLDFRIWFSKFVALQAFGEPRVHCLVSELLACRGVQTRRRHACATPCWSHAELTSQRLRHRSCVGAGQRTGQSSLGLFVSAQKDARAGPAGGSNRLVLPVCLNPVGTAIQFTSSLWKSREYAQHVFPINAVRYLYQFSKNRCNLFEGFSQLYEGSWNQPHFLFIRRYILNQEDASAPGR